MFQKLVLLESSQRSIELHVCTFLNVLEFERGSAHKIGCAAEDPEVVVDLER